MKNPDLNVKGVVLYLFFPHHDIHRNNICTAHWDKLKGIWRQLITWGLVKKIVFFILLTFNEKNKHIKDDTKY